MKIKISKEEEKRINEIIELKDERHYLQNLLEYAEETEKDLESIILDKIEWLYAEQYRLENK